jgi:hypothetical protein
MEKALLSPRKPEDITGPKLKAYAEVVTVSLLKTDIQKFVTAVQQVDNNPNRITKIIQFWLFEAIAVSYAMGFSEDQTARTVYEVLKDMLAEELLELSDHSNLTRQ